MRMIFSTRPLGAVSAALILVGCGATSSTEKMAEDRMTENRTTEETLAGDRMIVRSVENLKFETRPDGSSMAIISGDPTSGPSTILLRYKSGPIPMHTHPTSYHAVVLEGTAKHWAQGETEASSPALRPGSYWFQPSGLVHTDACVDPSGECMIFAHSLGKMGFAPAPATKGKAK